MNKMWVIRLVKLHNSEMPYQGISVFKNKYNLFTMINKLTKRRCIVECLMLGLLLTTISCNSDKKATHTSNEQKSVLATYTEPHRPQFHFSPDSMWMNDPNGMVFYEGEYHLFYQYYPDSTVWGPMHWGHAVSTDLVHWDHLPIALYPDKLGYIFSGSAVADLRNTSGFGSEGNPPLVAIYTYHDAVGADAGKIDYQTQGIAYSLDKGRTWTKYEGNPVLSNPGIQDFRDPKVFWHEETSKWIMILAVKDRIHLYSSDNLKEWQKESEFGEHAGAHGGVWECPDLFPLTKDGITKWVLLLSINPGGPNGGSATQYFVGDFDGHQFTVNHSDERWIDFGPDNYAGVTWSNVDDRKLFIGWMSNWHYSQVVPTERWRSAMTIPRELSFEEIGNEYYVKSDPVAEMENLIDKEPVATDSASLINGLARIEISRVEVSSFRIFLSNNMDEKLIIGFDKEANRYYVDRSQSGKVDFNEGFRNVVYAPRITESDKIDLTLFVDHSSVEVFADDGLSVMTTIFFPNENFTVVGYEIEGEPEISVNPIEGIW